MSCLYVVVNKLLTLLLVVGMRKDPKVGGGSEGTFKVTQNQPRHSPGNTFKGRIWVLKELGCLTLHKESDKCKKGISLKASTSQDQEDKDDDESDSEIDVETMTLLVRKFNKFLKKRGSSNRFQKKETRNSTFKNKNSKEKFSCHECGKDGHLKYQCPLYLKKVEGEKNTSMDFKSKKAYIAWDVPKEDSTQAPLMKRKLQRFVSW
ncbi:hypothetical protein Lal_00049299 [Lupinus albus]|nr:hypothetical protein Lal_00049299 [Lupinus albus]